MAPLIFSAGFCMVYTRMQAGYDTARPAAVPFGVYPVVRPRHREFPLMMKDAPR